MPGQFHQQVAVPPDHTLTSRPGAVRSFPRNLDISWA